MGTEIGDLDNEGAHASDSTFMILTCPSCATRYFVDDTHVGPEGRAVRCAACGERWTAHNEPPLELSHEPVDIADPMATIPRATVESLPAAPDTPAQDVPAEELPRMFRERAQTRRKVRQAATTGVVWAVLAVVLVVAIGGAVLLRQEIARRWPKTAGVYALIGLPVNLVGLTIEEAHARPALKDGHAAVIVTGVLRNVVEKAVVAPPLRVSLVDPAGHPIAVKIADPGGALIPPGEVRRFVVDLIDPPVSATDVEVSFVLNGPSRPITPPAGAPKTAKLSLRGAAGTDPGLVQGPVVASPVDAQDAKPLSASSPYALPRDKTHNEPNG